MTKIPLLLLAAVCSGSAMGHEITETLAGPVRGTLVSTKKPVDLELCVADAITQIGGAIPVPIRQGEANILVLGYGHTPKLIVSLISIPSGTSIEVRTRSGDMDDKLIRSVRESCKL